MAKMKQVFVANKRLNMSGGKLAAMTAHGAERFFSNWLKESVAREVEDGYQILLGARFDSEIFNNWMNSPTKIVLEAVDENQMQEIIRTAKEAGFVNGRDFFNIVDESTEFEDIPQWAVIAFKPMYCEAIDPITGGLNLYGHEDSSLESKLTYL